MSQSLNELAWPTYRINLNPFLWHLRTPTIWFHLHDDVENHVQIRRQPGSLGREEKQKVLVPFPAMLPLYNSHIKLLIAISLLHPSIL